MKQKVIAGQTLTKSVRPIASLSYIEVILLTLSFQGNLTNQPDAAGLKEDTFVRLFISEKDVLLKIDFINDVPFHSGELITSSLFSKTDNIQNILSNKISALSRDESKDFADLLFISRSFSFNWEQVINEAKQKDDWVNELDISKRFHEFAVLRFEGLKWIENIDLKNCDLQLKQMAVDVLNGAGNSIVASLKFTG